MRLLIATRYASTVGGVETYLKAVLPRLVAHADAVALLTMEPGGPGPDGLPVARVDWLPMAADTPAAVVERATLPEQRTIVGTLQSLPALAQEQRVCSPALIVIGSVVSLHAVLGQAARGDEMDDSRKVWAIA